MTDEIIKLYNDVYSSIVTSRDQIDQLYNVLASHITSVVCEDEINSLTANPNDGLFFMRNFFMANFIYSHSFCQKSAEVNLRRNISFPYFVLMSDLEYDEPGVYV